MEGSERGLHMVMAAGVQSQKQQAIMGARLHPCPPAQGPQGHQPEAVATSKCCQWVSLDDSIASLVLNFLLCLYGSSKIFNKRALLVDFEKVKLRKKNVCQHECSRTHTQWEPASIATDHFSFPNT